MEYIERGGRERLQCHRVYFARLVQIAIQNLDARVTQPQIEIVRVGLLKKNRKLVNFMP